MAENYRFHLARWNERDKSLKCPGCGRGHGCFKEYVDADGKPVDCDNHTVGKCDHEKSCGYHLTPSEWEKNGNKIYLTKLPKAKPRKVRRIEIEGKMVGKFHDYTKAVSNTFLRWIDSLPLTEDQRKSLPYLTLMYAIGTTRDGRVIWWQIDEFRKVRTGKIMQYAENGHRLKDAEGNSIGFGWVHSKLRQMGLFQESEGWELMQCLFGQHLLSICPDAEVHIVESEKTAFLMSLLDPLAMTKHIWLATGGLYNLNVAKLQPMKDRRIVCYPDANGIDKWREAIKGTNAHLSTKWMSTLTDQNGSGDDIGDVMVARLLSKQQPSPSPTPQEPQCAHRVSEGNQPPPTDQGIDPVTLTSASTYADRDAAVNRILNNKYVKYLIAKLQLYEPEDPRSQIK